MMRVGAVATFVVLLSSGAGVAQWTADGKPVPDNAWRQSKEGFGILLGLTDKPVDFEEEWAKSTRVVPISMPSSIMRNSPALFFLIFRGCPENAEGNCDVVEDLRLLKPDGSVYGEMKDVSFWQGQPGPSGKTIARATHAFGFSIDDDDPAGEYTMKVNVRDRVRNSSFTLERRFSVK